MKNTNSQFNFGAHVRARTQTKPVASLLPIALFTALVAALVFLG